MWQHFALILMPASANRVLTRWKNCIPFAILPNNVFVNTKTVWSVAVKRLVNFSPLTPTSQGLSLSSQQLDVSERGSNVRKKLRTVLSNRFTSVLTPKSCTAETVPDHTYASHNDENLSTMKTNVDLLKGTGMQANMPWKENIDPFLSNIFQECNKVCTKDKTFQSVLWANRSMQSL